MTTPATIASGLSAAQKRFVNPPPGRRMRSISGDDLDALFAQGLFDGHILAPRLTPLGAEVRRHLAAQREGGGDV